MEVYLDDHKTEISTPTDAAVKDLLAELKDRAGASGRMIVGIQCDGLDVTGDAFAETLAAPVNAFARIEMQTAEPHHLVTEALALAEQLLEASTEQASGVVDLIALGKADEALPKLGECCNAWLQVNQGVCNAVSMLHLDPGAVTVGEKTLPELMAVPADQLKQLKDVIEAGDFVLLSDILTYEFPEAIESWRQMIAAVRDAARQEVGG